MADEVKNSERYPAEIPVPRTGKIPFYYELKGGDPSLAVPNPVLCNALDEALKHLESGLSTRQVVAWLFQETGYKLSHTGLLKVWERLDPEAREKRTRDHLKPIKKRVKKLSREERSQRILRHKAGVEKRKIIMAKRRAEKMLEEIKDLGVVVDQRKEFENASVLQIDYSDVEETKGQLKKEVAFEPNPGPQTEFFEATELEVLYGGQAGGGKSYAIIADPMRYFNNPNFNGIILRRTNDELRDLINKQQVLYKTVFGEEIKWSEKKSNWSLPGGGNLWMTYLERDDDVLRYQGQAFSYIAFDELTQYPTPYPWNYMRSRLRTTDPNLDLCMRATTNPGGPGHGWVKRMFIDPAPANTTFNATNIETNEVLRYPEFDPDVPENLWGKPLFQRRFIPAKLSDNPHLNKDPSYRANLLSMPENLRRQLLSGDWTIAEGAAFPEFREPIHTCKPFEVPHTWRRFRSCDYGYSSYSAVHWYAIDPSDETLYVYRELYVSKATGEALASLVLEAEKDDRISYGVLDSSVWRKTGLDGPTVAEVMNMRGCRWKPSDRSSGSRAAGKNRLHELLKPRMTGTGEEKPGIIFFNTCRQIIADLPVIPSDPKGGDDIDDRYTSDHAYDSIRYGIMSRPRSRGPFDDWFSETPQQRQRVLDPIFGY